MRFYNAAVFASDYARSGGRSIIVEVKHIDLGDIQCLILQNRTKERS